MSVTASSDLRILSYLRSRQREYPISSQSQAQHSNSNVVFRNYGYFEDAVEGGDVACKGSEKSDEDCDPEWLGRRRQKKTTVRTLERQVKRQIVLEDGRIIEEDKPKVMTDTIEEVASDEASLYSSDEDLSRSTGQLKRLPDKADIDTDKLEQRISRYQTTSNVHDVTVHTKTAAAAKHLGCLSRSQIDSIARYGQDARKLVDSQQTGSRRDADADQSRLKVIKAHVVDEDAWRTRTIDREDVHDVKSKENGRSADGTIDQIVTRQTVTDTQNLLEDRRQIQSSRAENGWKEDGDGDEGEEEADAKRHVSKHHHKHVDTFVFDEKQNLYRHVNQSTLWDERKSREDALNPMRYKERKSRLPPPLDPLQPVTRRSYKDVSSNSIRSDRSKKCSPNDGVCFGQQPLRPARTFTGAVTSSRRSSNAKPFPDRPISPFSQERVNRSKSFGYANSCKDKKIVVAKRPEHQSNDVQRELGQSMTRSIKSACTSLMRSLSTNESTRRYNPSGCDTSSRRNNLPPALSNRLWTSFEGDPNNSKGTIVHPTTYRQSMRRAPPKCVRSHTLNTSEFNTFDRPCHNRGISSKNTRSFSSDQLDRRNIITTQRPKRERRANDHPEDDIRFSYRRLNSPSYTTSHPLITSSDRLDSSRQRAEHVTNTNAVRRRDIVNRASFKSTSTGSKVHNNINHDMSRCRYTSIRAL